MIAIAIFSADPVLRGSLEQLLRAEPTVTIVGVADDPSAVLGLIEENHVDVVLVDGTDPEDGIEALHAGAGAILPRFAARDEIVAAIKAVANGFAVLPRELMAALLGGPSLADELPDGHEPAGARLTPRELEVLAAMADGASNKAIARRLEISFHTAKFHVASILAKLDADSRTEAVARAAQLGLVML
jgi:DNA-binding NarL/FixJ family response regulator